MPRGIPLERLLSKRGVCSRAEARRRIAAGEVSVSGRVCLDPLRRFPAGSPLSVDGKPAPVPPSGRIALALNKARGVLTTSRDREGRPTVFGLLPPGGPRLIAAGRLDKASRGLLLFTNDPELANRLTDPDSHVPKTYHARLDRRLGEEDLARLAGGMTLGDGTRTRPCAARMLRAGTKSCWVELVLTEGRNRQVRRMAEALGARVLDLVRVAIGGLALGSLQCGESRILSQEEIRAALAFLPVSRSL